MRWLVPGGHLALLWSYPPWHGSQAWQRALADSMQHWMREAAATERVPADLDRHLAEEPHATLLEAAGFTIVGDFAFLTPHAWSVEQLIGFMYSTSVLSHEALGANAEAFARDLRARLLAAEPEGVFREEISFSYTLASTRSP